MISALEQAAWICCVVLIITVKVHFLKNRLSIQFPNTQRIFILSQQFSRELPTPVRSGALAFELSGRFGGMDSAEGKGAS